MYNRIRTFWTEKRIQSSTDLDAVVNGQAVTLAYNTTKLEIPTVSFHDTREIFEHGRVANYTGDVYSLFALQNAKRGWELFLKAFDEKQKIDESLIKEFQYALTVGTYDERRYMHGERPGEYKIGDYVTGIHEVGAPPEDVKDEICELLTDIGSVENKDALTAAAFFHAKFENIHPFADGNGRVGRLLMNYFLVCHDHPVITIHEEDRNEYMKALEAWDESQDLNPMKELLIGQTVKTWKKTVNR